MRSLDEVQVQYNEKHDAMTWNIARERTFSGVRLPMTMQIRDRMTPIMRNRRTVRRQAYASLYGP